ncbi:hypothetical protein BKP37_14295 [Anaerobacillus alkalilacustris]|uniref:Accessory regulator AgrB n=1 Tax=Anaerobacillus alkalilacustris TaxID=393763 RepID=A0A1S2LIN5_9BACI|nr:accessory gene regulator B family protein [Anaerobacillus alkalilacustris]OIJ12246.1 hypothetical protein BKP37_14295 [Anaerobacillus alkalilacustris]
MISQVSLRLAKALSSFGEKEVEVDYLRYGIEIILCGFIKLLVLFGTAHALGLLQPMITVLTTFAFFRTLTGGHHYSTYIRCLTAGLLMMTSISFFSTKLAPFFDFSILLGLLCFSTIFGLVLTYKYAPSNHFYKKTTEAQKVKLKKLAFVTTLLWMFLMTYFLVNSFSTNLILASMIGFLFQMSTIHPYSYSLVNKIEKSLERRKLS